MSSSVAAQARQQTEMPIGIKSQCEKQNPHATVRHLHAHARVSPCGRLQLYGRGC